MTGETEPMRDIADAEALPVPDPVSAPYFEAAARAELRYQRCAGGHAFLYPRLLCPQCHSRELRWETSAGDGEVVSFAAVHRPPWDELERPVPYVIVLVRLDEGPRLMSTLEQVAPEQVEIGMRVRAAFERVSDAIGLVRFVPG
jgi:uncharacterized OB-fold protein